MIREKEILELAKKINELIEKKLKEGFEIYSCEIGFKKMEKEEKKEVKERLKKLIFLPVKNNGDIFFLVKNMRIKRIEIRPVYVYGRYWKLKRGISQTKWKKYEESVHGIIEKAILPFFKGKKTYFHGAGREDVDVLCLGGREFVIEIEKPKKRFVELSLLEKEVNKCPYLKVKFIGYVDKKKVKEIKEKKQKKLYKAEIICDEEIKEEDLKKLKKLEGKIIIQQTPIRVLHRRADKIRYRRVYEIKTRLLGKNRFVAFILADHGLYIKELVSGDSGRTKPSFSSILGKNCRVNSLDVLLFLDK